MPKIIKNAEALILKEARRQVMEEGYSSVTVRSVAEACHMAVGTIYNYYRSKEMLVAGFMLEDWKVCLGEMRQAAAAAASPGELLGGILEGLRGFIRSHEAVFRDPAAGQSSAVIFPSQHALLRSQLEELLREPCRRLSSHFTDFLPAFLAESLLDWAGTEISFDTVYAVLKHLF